MSSGGKIVAGIILILLGALVQSDILDFLLNIIGWIIIIGGAVVLLMGIISIFKR